MLAKVIIRPLKFKTFNKHIITDYKIRQNGLLIIGNFLIPKQYCLILDGVEAVYYKYKFLLTVKVYFVT